MATDGSSSEMGVCPTEYRKLSLVLSSFPWATPHIMQVPKPLTDFTTVLSRHKHFIHALHSFERSLFSLGNSVVNTATLAPLIGLDIKKHDLEASSAVASVRPTSVKTTSDYLKLCSILCAYRTFEVLALDSEISVLQPPIRLLRPLSFPKSDRDSETLIGFDKLDDWPKVLLDFRTVMAQSGPSPSGPSQPSNKIHAGSKHLTLLRMTSQNGQKMGYINLVDNFLQAALHLFYLKMTEFPEGSLPDYPDLLNDHLRIFADETSTDHFIEDQEEGNHYLREIRRAGADASAPSTRQLSTPLLLSLLLSPFYLLFQFRITKRSYNRRLVLESFAGLSPYKTPLVLEIERTIWRSLIALADAAITPHEALSQLVLNLPWPAIEAASNSPLDRAMFCMVPIIAQPAPSPTVTQPTSHLDRPLAIQGPSTALTNDTEIGGSTPSVKTTASLSPSEVPLTSHDDVVKNKECLSRPSITPSTSTSDFAGDVASSSNTSHDTLFNKGRPGLPSVPVPMDMSMEMSICDQERPPSPPLGTASESRSSPVRSMQGQGSLENSLASLINRTFQSNLTLPSHSGTVDPSHLSSPLSLSGARNFSGKDDVTMEGHPSETEESSTSEDENSERPVRAENNSKSDAQPFHDDDIDDEEPSSLSSDGSTHGGVKKTEKKRPPGGKNGSKVNNKQPKGKTGSSKTRKGSKIPDALKVDEKDPRKRPRSDSLDKLPGNSRDNPINIDDFLSMFEPAVQNEYAKDEVISLGRPETLLPRITCKETFTVYDIDGNPHEFKPQFHHEIMRKKFKELMQLVTNSYIDGRPPHIADPNNSCLAKLKHADLSDRPAIEIQNTMRHKQVVVTGLPFDEAMQFDAEGLRTVIGSMTAQISINDFSVITGGSDPTPTVVNGYVSDLLENASSTGKILNGLDFPMWSSHRQFNSYETETIAWDITRGTHRIPLPAPFPTQDCDWGIAGLKHALTFVHIDCDGFNTRYGPKVGRKLWAFLRPRDSTSFSSIDFFTDRKRFSLSGKPQKVKYEDVKYYFEAVVLRPGDELHMQPNSPHWVYGIDDVIAHGGHYFSSPLMQETLQGIIHAFVLNVYLTNTEHLPSRLLLRRILIFYHVGLIEGRIPEKGLARAHLPNVETMEGVLNVICLAVLVILGNVLDFRTYSAPNQHSDDDATATQAKLMNTSDINAIPNNERVACCYARGVALHILDWLRSCTTFTGPPDGIADDLITLFFVQILASLSKYKCVAEEGDLRGAPHCTSILLDRQIANVVEVDPVLKAAWECRSHVLPDSLALQKKEAYHVQWLHGREPSWRAPCRDFTLLGQTPFDIKYFEATKQRIDSENASVIIGEGVQRPHKRVKVA